MKREAGWLAPVAMVVLKPAFHFLWRFDVTGLEHVPTEGPAILAPNHTSVLDSFVVPAVVPRPVIYVGKAEYLDDWKTKHLFPALGMIPIDRSGGSKSQGALDAAAKVLDAGGVFGIYPEGTRSRTGLLYRGHTGVARLALRTGAPIIPIGLQGTREVQPPDAPLPKPFMEIKVSFGEPVDPIPWLDQAGDPRVYRQITDLVMFEVARLSGQRYVDEYATKGAEAPLAPRRSSADVLSTA